MAIFNTLLACVYFDMDNNSSPTGMVEQWRLGKFRQDEKKFKSQRNILLMDDCWRYCRFVITDLAWRRWWNGVDNIFEVFSHDLGFVSVDGLDGIRTGINSQDFMEQFVTRNIFNLLVQKSQWCWRRHLRSKAIIHQNSWIHTLCPKINITKSHLINLNDPKILYWIA